MRFYGSFAKVDAEQRIVEGYASTEATDAHGEIVLKSAVEAALDDYLEYGNIREMHQLSAVGTATDATMDDNGLYLTAKIVDDTAWGKVTSGVYKGFSIGGKVLGRDPDNRRLVTKIRLDEISLVDRPSNPDAKFDLWRAAGVTVTDPVARALSVLAEADGKIAALAPTEAASPGEALLKLFCDQQARIDELEKRLAEPLPPRTFAGKLMRAVSKEEDSRGRLGPEDAIEEAEVLLAGMNEEDRALTLIKAAHRLPRTTRS